MGILKRILAIVAFFVASNAIGQTAVEFFKKGNEQINAQNYTQAIADYSKAISLNPDFKQAYKNRGISYSLSNQHEKAIADYTKAITFSAEDFSLYSYRGMAMFELANGDAEKVKLVIPDLEKAIELNPDFVEGYLNLTKTYTVLNYHDKAIESATTAIKKDPENGKAYYDRGVAHHNNKNLIMACLDWKRAKGKGFEYAGSALTSYCE